jgi:hypothetical protein
VAAYDLRYSVDTRDEFFVDPLAEVGVLVLAALTPVTPHVPPLLAATAAMAVLAGVAIVDAARIRRHPGLLSPRAGEPS